MAALALVTPAAARADAVPYDFAGAQLHDGYLLDHSPGLQGPAAAGVGVVRVWLYWDSVERQPGQYDFSRWDTMVANAAQAHIRILPVIVEPPSFYSSEPWIGGADGHYPPANALDMAGFAAVLVGRYGSAGSFWDSHPELPRVPIKSWQVWNEPNIRPWWASGPDAGAYTYLLTTVSGAIHSCDPTAEVVAAGMPNSPAPGIYAGPFLDAMYQAGAKGAADTLAIHPYAGSASGVLSQVADFRAVMDRYGDHAPIWLTEFGWATAGPPDGDNLGVAGQAAAVTSTLDAIYAQRGALGLRGFTYYQWDDTPTPPDPWDAVWYHMGLVNADYAPKPSFYAYRDAVAGFDRLPQPVDAGPPAGSRPCPPSVGRAAGRALARRAGVARANVGRVAGLWDVTLRPRRFRTHGRRAGAELRFYSTEAGKARVRFERLVRRHAKVQHGKISFPARLGRNRHRITGRIGARALAPGHYRLRLEVLTRADAKSRVAKVPFTILR